jgi:tRNA A37 methylthiotransferase MiaB
VAEEVAQQELQLYRGHILDVLVEGSAPGRPGQVTGTSCRYAPVILPGHLPSLLRRRLPVRIVGVEKGVLLGQAVPPTHTGRVDLLALP